MVLSNLRKMYPESAFAPVDFHDYFISLSHNKGLRRYIKPQARFMCDDAEPFKPLSASQGFAMLEWGMNWAISSHEVNYVILHAAVLAKGDDAIVFPARSGSGKSTLTAHLMQNGWRLLSDEMALIKPGTLEVIPMVRPICLKNASIELAKSWFKEVEFSSIAHHTHKGNVIHMAPNKSSQQNASRPATIRAVVFPEYHHEVFADIYPLSMAKGFEMLHEHAFNYLINPKAGLATLVGLMENTQRYKVVYNDLSELNNFLNEDVLP